MQIPKKNWIVKRAVLGFAVGALIAPAAAQGARGGVVSDESTARTRLVGPHQQPALPCAPNCAAEQLGTGAPSTVSTTQLVSSPGFDWGDAGIGAGVAIGFVLLGGAGLAMTHRAGEPQTA
jgi:hypothetical protein